MAKKTVTHTSNGFEAEIDNATMMQLEAAATTQARGQQRRLVLMACWTLQNQHLTEWLLPTK